MLDLFYLSKGGIAFPVPVWGIGQLLALVGALIGVAVAVYYRRRALRRFEETGRVPRLFWPTVGTILVFSFAGWVAGGAPTSWNLPEQGEFAVTGGGTVVLPQALRVIIPPMTNQYLNLTKNSSLAVAIGYPDVVSIANTAINQTGRAVECIAIIMLVYLTTSLSTSAFMNWYNKRAAIRER